VSADSIARDRPSLRRASVVNMIGHWPTPRETMAPRWS